MWAVTVTSSLFSAALGNMVGSIRDSMMASMQEQALAVQEDWMSDLRQQAQAQLQSDIEASIESQMETSGEETSINISQFLDSSGQAPEGWADIEISPELLA